MGIAKRGTQAESTYRGYVRKRIVCLYSVRMHQLPSQLSLAIPLWIGVIES